MASDLLALWLHPGQGRDASEFYQVVVKSRLHHQQLHQCGIGRVRTQCHCARSSHLSRVGQQHLPYLHLHVSFEITLFPDLLHVTLSVPPCFDLCAASMIPLVPGGQQT
jgi:hypothetical protein